MLVVEATVATTRRETPYLKATLRDRAGRTVRAVHFDFAGVAPCPAQLVAVRGYLGEHDERPQLKLDRMRVLGDADPCDWAVEVDVPLAERRARLRAAVDTIAEPHLRLLVDAVLAGQVLERFLLAPAAKRWRSTTRRCTWPGRTAASGSTWTCCAPARCCTMWARPTSSRCRRGPACCRATPARTRRGTSRSGSGGSSARPPSWRCSTTRASTTSCTCWSATMAPASTARRSPR
jgi:hypothetical protein